MAAIFWLIVAIDWWRSDDREARTHILLASTAAVALSLIPVILNYVLTGAVMATGAQAKSWFQNVPFRPGDILTSVGRDFLRILQRLSLGFLANPPWPLIPLLLPASLLGWIVLWFRKRYSVVGLTLGWFVAGAGSMATLITAIWQRGRYQVPMVAFLLPIAVVAGAFLLERLPESRRKITGAISVTLLVTLSIWQTGVSINSYAHSVYSTAKQQIAIAEWIDANLPQGARVAVHDAGAIRFIGNRDTFDMIGLTSQGVASAWRHGMGAVFEHMENAEDRPGYFATYPDVFSIPYLQETDLFSNELYRVSLPDFSRHSSAGPTQVVYDANWRLANSGEAMIQEDLIHATARMELVDSIDVADLEDERRHNFTWSEGPVIPGFPTEVRQFQYRTAPEHTVLDGGRLLTGAMAFEVSVEPGTNLMIIGRFHAQDPVTLDVRANGKSVGRWRYPAISGEWLESAFQIPADYVTSNPLEIQLALSDASAPGIKFEPYYLWFQQGEYNEVRPAPRQRINTRFAEGLELVGYDLDSRQYRPGETLPLVLYWRSDKRNDVDAVVFVHLYSENGEVVAQLDQRPYFGTRPPYTWNADEIVTDPISLELPCHLSDGRYDLVVGLYDRRTLTRMEIIKSDLTVLADNRLLLRTLTLDTDCRITVLLARFSGPN